MASRQPTQQKPLTIPILLGSVLLGAAAIYDSAPGLLLTLIGVVVAASMHQPASFTGPKDKATGYPTAAHAGEEVEMKKYRFWSDVKSSTFSGDVIMPGWPIKLSWVYSVVAAVGAAILLPADGTKFAALLKITDAPEVVSAITHWGSLANAVGAFLLVGTLANASRNNAQTGSAAPAVTHKHFTQLAREDTGTFVGMLLGGAIAGGAIAAVLGIFAPVYQQWVPIPAWGWFVTVIPAGALAFLGMKLTRDARVQWTLMIAGNEEWKPRWENAKVTPPPRLVNRTTLGNIVIDEFEAAPGSTPSTYVDLGLRRSIIVPDFLVFALYRPKRDEQGQDVPRTQHATNFKVVLWPENENPDVTDASTPMDIMNLWVECQLPMASYGGGLFPTYQFDHLELLTAAPVRSEQVSDSVEGQVVAYVKKKDRVAQAEAPAPAQDSPAIWKLVWWRPGGAADPRMFRERCAGALSGSLGAQAAVDHRADGGNGTAFFGALWDMNLLDPSLGIDPKMIPNILEEDDWTGKWANADSKLGVNPPLPQFPTKETAQLSNGVAVNKMAFMCRQGVTPSTFFGMEEVLKTAMGGIPFVAISGFPDTSSRPGERHPLAFTLYWSDDVVPVKPEMVRPVLGPNGSARGGSDAPNWVLAGLINQAFKAARLAQPEMISADSLSGVGTGMRAVSSNLWKIQLRLYGGVTLSDVRAQTRRIQESLATEWLRIVERPDGCTIVLGANPRKLKIADQAIRDYIENLNWQQAWEAAKVIGLGGRMPKLVSTRQFESNDQVTELIFEIPEGLSIQSFRDAREKLKTASGNGFIQVDSVAESAKQVKLTVSETDPMPVRAGYDWEYLKTSKGFPIGVGVTGVPIEFIPREHIHFLVTGSAGSGKSVTMQTQVVAAVAHDFDLYIADPTKGATDFSFAKPYAKAFCTTTADTAAMMQGIYKEVLRRVDLIKNTPGTANIYQLDPALGLNPIALVLDEFTSMISSHHIEKGDLTDEDAIEERERMISENNEKQKIGSLVARVAREARSAGVSLILGTQKLASKDMDSIPGGNTLKNNLSRSIAGKSSLGDRQSALREPFDTPDMGDVIPKGRLIYEPSTSKSVLVQGWYDPGEQDALGEFLHREGYPQLTEADLMDLDEFRPRERNAEPLVLELEEFEISLDDLFDDIEASTVETETAVEPSTFFGDLPGESFRLDDDEEDDDSTGDGPAGDGPDGDGPAPTTPPVPAAFTLPGEAFSFDDDDEDYDDVPAASSPEPAADAQPAFPALPTDSEEPYSPALVPQPAIQAVDERVDATEAQTLYEAPTAPVLPEVPAFNAASMFPEPEAFIVIPEPAAPEPVMAELNPAPVSVFDAWDTPSTPAAAPTTQPALAFPSLPVFEPVAPSSDMISPDTISADTTTLVAAAPVSVDWDTPSRVEAVEPVLPEPARLEPVAAEPHEAVPAATAAADLWDTPAPAIAAKPAEGVTPVVVPEPVALIVDELPKEISLADVSPAEISPDEVRVEDLPDLVEPAQSTQVHLEPVHPEFAQTEPVLPEPAQPEPAALPKYPLAHQEELTNGTVDRGLVFADDEDDEEDDVIDFDSIDAAASAPINVKWESPAMTEHEAANAASAPEYATPTAALNPAPQPAQQFVMPVFDEVVPAAGFVIAPVAPPSTSRKRKPAEKPLPQKVFDEYDDF